MRLCRLLITHTGRGDRRIEMNRAERFPHGLVGDRSCRIDSGCEKGRRLLVLLVGDQLSRSIEGRGRIDLRGEGTGTDGNREQHERES